MVFTTCRHCRGPLPTERRINRLYCSQRCRARAWRRQQAGLDVDLLNGTRGAARGRLKLDELTHAQEQELVRVQLAMLEMTRVEVRDYARR
jgi:hypothetical protein